MTHYQRRQLNGLWNLLTIIALIAGIWFAVSDYDPSRIDRYRCWNLTSEGICGNIRTPWEYPCGKCGGL